MSGVAACVMGSCCKARGGHRWLLHLVTTVSSISEDVLASVVWLVTGCRWLPATSLPLQPLTKKLANVSICGCFSALYFSLARVSRSCNWSSSS